MEWSGGPSCAGLHFVKGCFDPRAAAPDGAAPRDDPPGSARGGAAVLSAPGGGVEARPVQGRDSAGCCARTRSCRACACSSLRWTGGGKALRSGTVRQRPTIAGRAAPKAASFEGVAGASGCGVSDQATAEGGMPGSTPALASTSRASSGFARSTSGSPRAAAATEVRLPVPRAKLITDPSQVLP